MTSFGYPVSLNQDFQIEIDSDGVTVNGRSKHDSGHVKYADVAGIFIWDSGGTINERTLSLSLRDGRTASFRVPLKRPHVGTDGAPTWDHDAAMKEFHAAASSVLRQLMSTRPDLPLVELGPAPSARRLLRIIGGCGVAALIGLLLLFRSIDQTNSMTVVPYVGWATLSGLYIWFNWIQKPKKLAINKLADTLATQPAKLPN